MAGCLFPLLSVAADRSPREEDVAARLSTFYAPTIPADTPFTGPPKFGATPVDPYRYYRAKTDPASQKEYCEKFLKKHFPDLHCDRPSDTRAGWEEYDKVESLARTWVDAKALVYDMDALPKKGEVENDMWSDDYWATLYGQTSYRYATRQRFNSIDEMLRHYKQPDEWKDAKKLAPDEITRRTLPWSPSEKYDLTTGDETFALTTQQKQLAVELKAQMEKEKWKYEDVTWFGLCHGWAPASLMVSAPKKAVTVVGAGGARVTWYPYDVRALATLFWGNGKLYYNFIGKACRDKKPKRHPNGRLVSPECFDTNPATFHLALANLIGKAHVGFVMDASLDWAVWNQPVKKYEFRYFDPLNTERKSESWADVAVPYDDTFKRRDPFQKPMTRGKRYGDDKYDDSRIKKIVGVEATVTYLDGLGTPPHQAEAGRDYTQTTTYLYDLELVDVGGKLRPEGGEWRREDAHPDFLWVPRRDTYSRSTFDFVDVQYRGDATQSERLAETAQASSAEGYPLCQVLKYLVKESSGKDTVRCPRPRQ